MEEGANVNTCGGIADAAPAAEGRSREERWWSWVRTASPLRNAGAGFTTTPEPVDSNETGVAMTCVMAGADVRQLSIVARSNRSSRKALRGRR